MAAGTLTNTTIATTYKSLLKVKGGANNILDEDIQLIEDGDGVDSVLGLATDSALISGDGSKLYFYDANGGEHISANTSGVLSIAAGAEIDLTATAIDLNGTLDLASTLTIAGITKMGASAGSGADAFLYTAGTAAHVGLQWDADGNTEGTLIGGADDHGVDFKFFGETTGKYVQWDQSGDELVLAGSGTKISFYDAAGGEYISGDGSTLSVVAGGASVMKLDANSKISLSNNDGDNTGNTIFGKSAWNQASNDGSDYNTLFGEGIMGTGSVSGAAYNTVIGMNAVQNITTGDMNCAMGQAAGQALTTGANNVFLGRIAGATLTTSGNNTLVGYGSGTAIAAGQTTTDGTTAVGYNSLAALTSGARNLAIGYQAADSLTTSSDNIAMGYQALQTASTNISANIAIGNYALDGLTATETVTNNIAIGYAAGGAVTTADNCTIVGHGAGQNISTGGTNIAIGSGAMGGSSALTGAGNVAIGYAAGNVLEGVAADNTIVGGNAGDSMTTGANNALFGSSAGDALTTGSQNTLIGRMAGLTMTTSSNNVLVGYGAGDTIAAGQTTTNGTVGIGYNALTALTTGDGNVAIGFTSGAALTDGQYNTLLGYEAGLAIDGGTSNVYIGWKAGYSQDEANHCIGIGHIALANSTNNSSHNNIAIGSNSLDAIADGVATGNVCVGFDTGTEVTTGDSNTFIGTGAGDGIQTANLCVAIGNAALSGAETQTGTIAIGGAAGESWTTGIGNVGVGAEVAKDMTTGAYNTIIGYKSMYGTVAADAPDGNTIVGYQAAYALRDGANNTCVGNAAGDTITTGDANTCIGVGSDCAATADNQIAIGNGAVTDGANKGRWGNASVSTNNIQTDWTVDSDRRIKKDIEDSDIGLSFVNSLKPRKFKKIHPSEYDAELLEKRYKKGGSNYDDGKGEVIKDEFDEEKVWDGLIAQEVKESMDNLGVEFSGWGEESNGKQGIAYSTLVTPLIKAVQELSAKVEELEAKLK